MPAVTIPRSGNDGRNRLAKSAAMGHGTMVRGLLLILVSSMLGLCSAGGGERVLRDPVHPRMNVEEFAPVTAAKLRFTVTTTVFGEPCLDELEVYGPEEPGTNLALAAAGTVAGASGSLPDYRIHRLAHIHDGRYGNAYSWIADTTGRGWVELTFPREVRVQRVVWSRDREGKFTDRLATGYRVEVAREGEPWRKVADSGDRAPVDIVLRDNPVNANSIRRIAPGVAVRDAGEQRPRSGYVVRTWQTPDGLPSDTVTALLAARDGWLWVGTTHGVARFDGTDFRYLGEEAGLPALNVTCLAEDAAGLVWVGTEGGGAAVWDGSRFRAHAVSSDAAGGTVLALAVAADGGLWAGTGSALLQWNGKVFERKSEVPATRLAATAEGIWLVSHHVLRRWSAGRPAEISAVPDPSRFSAITALAAGRDGALWFGGANEYVGRYADGRVQVIGEGHAALLSSAWELYPAPDGDVWVGTSGSGLARIRGDAILQVTTDDGLASNAVTAVCGDREGNIWAGTSGGGLSRLSPRRVESLTSRDGLSHDAILALAEDSSGNLWLGTNGGGLNRVGGGGVEPFAPSFSLENKSFTALCTTASGELWAGALDAGLFRMASGKVSRFGRGDGLPSASVTALCASSTGGVWIGTLDGGVAHASGEEITVPGSVAELRGLPVTAVLDEAGGGVWFATAGQGVARLSDGRLQRWSRRSGLASDFVQVLARGSDASVWAGTKGWLSRWRGGAWFSFGTPHGLPDVIISQIADDGSGSLWLGTNRGILRISLASLDAVGSGRTGMLDVFALGSGDGLPSLECSGGGSPGCLLRRDGRLCFGTPAGLAVVDPRQFAPPSVAVPAVVVEPGGTRLELPAAAPRLAVQFTALHFTAPERLRFRYRLAGLETSWNEGSSRQAFYPHLPPGDFRFEVTASTDGVVWSSTPATVAVTVPRVWWQRPWVAVPCAALLLGGLMVLVRAITRRRLQRRLGMLEERLALERERSRISRDLHDDLGTHLTEISLLSALGRQEASAAAKADGRFAAISETVSDLAQKLDAIVWAVNPRHDNLESLARYVSRFAGDLCRRFGLRLRLEVPTQLPDAAIGSDQRHSLFLAVKEALHNALRHSGATEVRLMVSAADGELVMTVSDDGSGMLPAGDGESGDGLGNMRQRLSESGGRCEIDAVPGSGTSVRFTLPLSPMNPSVP